MARINISKLGQIGDAFAQADILSQTTMVGGVFLGFGTLKLLNKLVAKTGFVLSGLVVYLIAGVLGLALPGVLQIKFPEFTTYINYGIIILGIMSLIWIIYDLVKSDSTEIEDEDENTK